MGRTGRRRSWWNTAHYAGGPQQKGADTLAQYDEALGLTVSRPARFFHRRRPAGSFSRNAASDAVVPQYPPRIANNGAVFIATARESGTAHVFDTSMQGDEIANLIHTGRVTSMEFSDDSKYMATASSNPRPYYIDDGESYPVRTWLLQPSD
jgi:hypothetical protein